MATEAWRFSTLVLAKGLAQREYVTQTNLMDRPNLLVGTYCVPAESSNSITVVKWFAQGLRL